MMDFIKDLGVHILGVSIGGLIAYTIARWQFEANEIVLNRKRQVLLKENVHRIHEELKKNLEIIMELKRVLHQSSNPGVDVLEWGAAYVDSFSFFSFNHLSGSSFHVLLPAPLEKCIFESYSELERLQNRYRQTIRAHHYSLESHGAQETENLDVTNMKAAINEVMGKLETNINEIKGFSV